MTRGVSFAAAVLTVVFVPAPGIGQSRKQEPPATLIARGTDFFVHALANPRLDRGSWGASVATGYQLLYTARPGGKMKVLLTTGTRALPTRRIRYVQTQFVGLAADSERLYVVESLTQTWDRPPVESNAKGEGETPAKGPAPGVRASFTLHVFWLGDGSKLASLNLTGPHVPTERLPETTGRGPLQLIDNGVSCFGKRMTFRGKEVEKDSP